MLRGICDRLFGKVVTFFCAPGAPTDDPVTDALLRGHENEAAEHHAEFYNYGWVQGDNSILSKTSQGKLASQIDPTTMHVIHEWF